MTSPGGGSWAHMYARAADCEGGGDDFWAVFATPTEFLSFLEALCGVLCGDEEGEKEEVQRRLVSACCLQCGALVPLGPCPGSLGAGAGVCKELACALCGFHAQRCMYTHLPLFEGGGGATATALRFRRCHLCHSASFCGEFLDNTAENVAAEFEWLPFGQFNAAPATCLYCALLLTEFI